MLKYIDGNSPNFTKKLELLLEKRKVQKSSKSLIVKKIIKDIKKNKDKALIKYEKKFSNNILKNLNSIKFSEMEIKKIS